MEEVVILLPMKLFLIQNIISQSKLIISIPIHKFHNIIKNIAFHASATIRNASKYPRFNLIKCTAKVYTNQNLVTIFYVTEVSLTMIFS